MPLSKPDLYQIVETYAGFGPHRTGSAADRATADWLAERLAELGGAVEKQPFEFSRFEHETTLTAGGVPVDALPMYYRSTGSVDTETLGVVEMSLDHEDGAADPIPDLCRRAMADGHDALVLATKGDTGGLVAINRPPNVIGDIPVVLIAGRDFERVRTGRPHLTYAASLSKDTAHNVIARFGDPAAAGRIVLTTPFSGWFGCAGERGTGIAVLLGLVEALRGSHAFTVIAASGHELMYLGGDIAAARHGSRPDLVMHLGSCIATLNGHLDAVLHAPAATHETVREALAPLDARLRMPDAPHDPSRWVGESRCWAGMPARMLSIAGTAPDFHTPEDTASRATTPELLEQSLTSIRNALDVLLGD